MSSSDKYVCTLDQSTLEYVKTELNEDPETRDGKIQELREWVEKQSHFTSKTDDIFLLSFLRRAKFDMAKAQEKVEHFWKMRSVTAPDWFQRDLSSEKFKALLDAGCYIPLPGRLDKNRKAILMRTEDLDFKKYTQEDLILVQNILMDIMMLDELNTIYPKDYLLDHTGLTLGFASSLNKKQLADSLEISFETYPMREGFSYEYNMPFMLNAIQKVMLLLMSDDMKKGVVTVKSLEAIHKHIPMSMLPEEYGGTAGPLKKINEAWIEEINSKKEYLESFSNYGFNLSKLTIK